MEMSSGLLVFRASKIRHIKRIAEPSADRMRLFFHRTGNNHELDHDLTYQEPQTI